MRIIDLAREMVRLLGKEGQVEIKITGLRPGEKLHEELTFPAEELTDTPHPKINKVIHSCELSSDFDTQMGQLIEVALSDDERRLRVLLSELVPTYEASVPRRRFVVEKGGAEALA